MYHGLSDSRRLYLAALCAVLVSLTVVGCRMPGADAQTEYARLSALQVTGGTGMYPDFDPGVLHYAVRCADQTQLQVSAQCRGRRRSPRAAAQRSQRDRLGASVGHGEQRP